MAEGEKTLEPEPPEQAGSDSGTPAPARRFVTRRDFLIKSNAGAVAAGVVTGVSFAAGLAQRGAEAPRVAKPPAASAPMTMRRITLDIDGRKYDVTVDVRESLWETLNYELGLSNCNLGCDRAQCGACAVLVDGKAVNGCTVLTARLGRGQKILTVGGIAPGPGPEGLHPLQRAFWLDGGFQCGICTRGFIMSAYALLHTNKNPTDAQIKDALSGNICRCGEYIGVMSAVKKAAAELRGERVTYKASLTQTEEAKPSPAPAAGGVSRQFEFVTPLGTIEQFDELSLELKQRPGILGVSGSERTITLAWDPARLDEARVRQILAEAGHPVRQ